MNFIGVLIVITALFTWSCSPLRRETDPNELATLNIIDRNGFSETISTPERLKEYESTDFLAIQPYQKVLRVYQRDKLGQVHACITSYHPNGQIKQYLEVVNGRAFGLYREWYADGIMKLEANIIGGEGDLHTAAEQSWLFDSVCRSWDDKGHILAEINYSKGVLEGYSLYYHPNGALWKKVPFIRGEVQGTHETYRSDNSLLQQMEYVQGKKEGEAIRFWQGPSLCRPEGALEGETVIASKEYYRDDLLLEGSYWDRTGQKISEIVGGEGIRAIFSRDGVAELQRYHQGVLSGEITRFNSLGQLSGKHGILHGLKQGEEIEFYPSSLQSQPQPQLLITWYEGKIQGPVKTWYPNGAQESQREMSNNSKNGLAMAWYRDGSLMLLEEYVQDKLMKGEYYLMGEQRAVSFVREGTGIATLFDGNGTFLRKVIYRNGVPFD